MATFIIVTVLILYTVFAFRQSRKRIQNGCCGGSNTSVLKEKVNPKDYAYHKQYKAEGMHCENCAAKIKQGLDQLNNVKSDVSLKKNTVDIYSNKTINQQEIFTCVEELGYKLIEQ